MLCTAPAAGKMKSGFPQWNLFQGKQGPTDAYLGGYLGTVCVLGGGGAVIQYFKNYQTFGASKKMVHVCSYSVK